MSTLTFTLKNRKTANVKGNGTGMKNYHRNHHNNLTNESLPFLISLLKHQENSQIPCCSFSEYAQKVIQSKRSK